jgi:hypothetical protein
MQISAELAATVFSHVRNAVHHEAQCGAVDSGVRPADAGQTENTCSDSFGNCVQHGTTNPGDVMNSNCDYIPDHGFSA